MCYNVDMLNIRRVCANVCREGSGARTFFTGILMWGVGMGCFNASFHNFIVDEYLIGGFDRGVLEFMRGHPVSKAMHGSAMCCRGCMEKWWKVPRHRPLTPVQERKAVDFLMAWIARQISAVV